MPLFVTVQEEAFNKAVESQIGWCRDCNQFSVPHCAPDEDCAASGGFYQCIHCLGTNVDGARRAKENYFFIFAPDGASTR